MTDKHDKHDERARQIWEDAFRRQRTDGEHVVQLIASALREVEREALEKAATTAENERMTGIPPIGQWAPWEIDNIKTTCKVTGRSIATKIRAFIEQDG